MLESEVIEIAHILSFRENLSTLMAFNGVLDALTARGLRKLILQGDKTANVPFPDVVGALRNLQNVGLVERVGRTRFRLTFSGEQTYTWIEGLGEPIRSSVTTDSSVPDWFYNLG